MALPAPVGGIIIHLLLVRQVTDLAMPKHARHNQDPPLSSACRNTELHAGQVNKDHFGSARTLKLQG